MKFLIFCFALISTFAMANPSQEGAKECAGYAQLSGAVMTAVQRGIPMEALLESMNYEQRIVLIASEAYKVKPYRTKEYQDMAILEFSNDVMVACMSRL